MILPSFRIWSQEGSFIAFVQLGPETYVRSVFLDKVSFTHLGVIFCFLVVTVSIYIYDKTLYNFRCIRWNVIVLFGNVVICLIALGLCIIRSESHDGCFFWLQIYIGYILKIFRPEETF